MAIPHDVLDELCSRFLVNLPDEERLNPVRICFQAELAHWFYIDFYCNATDDTNATADGNKQKPVCRPCGIREFIRTVFGYLPYLKQHAPYVDQIVEEWRSYKSSVPVYGAILIDDTEQEVLLVQGYYAKCSWGFPKGKVNENESPQHCAVREVLEETGFDISGRINDGLYVERKIGENITGLYLVPGVAHDFDFRPRTRHEIKRIRWFRIADLPQHRADCSKNALGIYPSSFFTVIPFVEVVTCYVRTHSIARALAQPLAVPTTPGHRPRGRESTAALAVCCNSTGGPHGTGVWRHTRRRSVSTPLLDKLQQNGCNGIINRLMLVRPQYVLPPNQQRPGARRRLRVDDAQCSSAFFALESPTVASPKVASKRQQPLQIPASVPRAVSRTDVARLIRLRPAQAWQNVHIDWSSVLQAFSERPGK